MSRISRASSRSIRRAMNFIRPGAGGRRVAEPAPKVEDLAPAAAQPAPQAAPPAKVALVDAKVPQVSVAEDSPPSRTNFVFAHFMVGNTYPYTLQDWEEDILLAASQHIDGFVLNVGHDEWQRKRVRDCFAAAERLPNTVDFKFFFSFDMTSIAGDAAEDVELFEYYIASHCESPRMFRHHRTGGVVVSTFSGEHSTFGQKNMETGWLFVKTRLGKLTKIHFVPSFFINPARFPDIFALDGVFNWNGGWPLQLQVDVDSLGKQHQELDSDHNFLVNLEKEQTFMGAISPWFFTHYGPDSWNKNWIYRADDWLFVRRWEQLIAMRDRIEIAQIISWNDYGESHYVGPIKGAQPNSEAWVDGYPHVGWLYLNAYFASAFQTGKFPTITKDQIFVWARPHPKDAITKDTVPRPRDWQLVEDIAWAVIFATSPCTIEVHTSYDSCHIANLDTGMTKLSFPLEPDGGMNLIMLRDDKVIAECPAVGYRFESRPGSYNFNAFVAMSSDR